MPFYLSIAGLRARHGTRFLTKGITGNTAPPDLDQVAAARAIADAESLINTSIGTRNKLPLPGVTDRPDPENNGEVPDVLRMLTADIAFYRMAAEASVMTEEKKSRFKAACEWLKQYSRSEVSLGIENAEAVPSATGIHRSGPARVMTRCDTDGLL